MRKAIIIPIYLKFNQPDELAFSEGLKLAKRAIESLRILEDQDFTLILPVCFDLTGEDPPESFEEMTRFLIGEVKSLRREKTLVFCTGHLKQLRDYLARIDFKKFSSLIDLKGFAKIRNTGLLFAQALSMDVAIFIDNDEVVDEPQYLKIACEYLNEKWNGKVVSGKGGFYVNPVGTILLPPQRLWWRFLWNKTKWMNRVLEKILSSKDRLVPSPMLLGGNLVLHRHLFGSIPFDPYIPRGEDTDYLINAGERGFNVFFDKALRVKHLHPERTEVYFEEELKGDIERFLYERGKTKMGSRVDLNPYPGYFMDWTLYPKAVITSLLLNLDYLVKGEWEKSGQCIANIRLLLREQGGWLKYLNFMKDWEKVMGKIEKDGMSEILEKCWI
jgi:hypothetical protein